MQNLSKLSNFLKDETKKDSYKQIVIIDYFQKNFEIENENFVKWLIFCYNHLNINNNINNYLLSTLTPFQEYYLSIVSDKNIYPLIYKIPRNQIKIILNTQQYIVQFRKYKQQNFEQKFFLMFDEEFKKLWLIINLEYKIEIHTMDENYIYFCFDDVQNLESSEFYMKFKNLKSTINILNDYKYDLSIDKNDYFVYYNFKSPIKYIFKGIPTLLGNFIAAEKLYYHKIFKENDLIHPSTLILYGRDFYNKIINQIEYLQERFSFEQLSTKYGQKYKRIQNNKIIKIPFSSSSRSIELGHDLKKLFNDYFVEYGCIIQKVNLYNVQRRVSINFLATYEIRCFIIDGKVLCGVILIRGHKIRLFNVIYNNKKVSIEINPKLTEFLENIRKYQSEWKRVIKIKQNKNGTYDIKYIDNTMDYNVEKQYIDFKDEKQILAKSKFKKFSEFIMDCIELVSERYNEIISIAERAFECFNNIIITKELPNTLLNFPLQVDQGIINQNHVLLKQKRLRKYYSIDRVNNLKLIQKFLENPENYLNRRFYEKFLRIDVMYWYDLDKFYINEIETFACGKLESEYNDNIFSLLYSNLI